MSRYASAVSARKLQRSGALRLTQCGLRRLPCRHLALRRGLGNVGLRARRPMAGNDDDEAFVARERYDALVAEMESDRVNYRMGGRRRCRAGRGY